MSTVAVFGYPSLSRNFALSGGAWNAAYPLSNLIANLSQPQLKRVARTIDAAATSSIIRGSAGSDQLVGAIMAAGNNMTANALVRIRLFSDAGWSAQVYDSGFIPRPGVWWVGNNYTCRSYEFSANDAANPAGYIELGYLEVATQVQPKYTYQYGADFGFRGRTQKAEALGGAIYFDRRPKPRTFSGTFTATKDEGLSLFLKMQEVYDIDLPFIWLPDPSEPAKWRQTAFLARFVELNPLRYANYGLDEAVIAIEEVL